MPTLNKPQADQACRAGDGKTLAAVPSRAAAALARCEVACERIVEQYGAVHCGIDFAALLATVRRGFTECPSGAVDASGEDDRWTIDRAADFLEGYADHIRSVGADNLQYWPYLPEVEMVAKDLRKIAAATAAAPASPLPLTNEQVFAALEAEAKRLNGGTLDGLQMNEEMLSEVIKIFRIAERAHGIQAPATGDQP